MNNNEDEKIEEYRCSYLSLASATSDDVNVDHAITVCGKISTRALACICAGDRESMLGCPEWRNVFVQERLWEALMKIAHNVKECGGKP